MKRILKFAKIDEKLTFEEFLLSRKAVESFVHEEMQLHEEWDYLFDPESYKLHFGCEDTSHHTHEPNGAHIPAEVTLNRIIIERAFMLAVEAFKREYGRGEGKEFFLTKLNE